MMAPAARPSAEQGFSLIETCVALLVLGVGLLSLAQVFTAGLSSLNGAGFDIIAREKATEAIESVFTARDTKTLAWAQIRNVEGEDDDGGVFLDGERPLTVGGDDGLVNTADDGDVEAVILPGADGDLGTDDDIHQPLATFTREIEIRDVSLNLRRVRVIIRYRAGSTPREYAIDTFISFYS